MDNRETQLDILECELIELENRKNESEDYKDIVERVERKVNVLKLLNQELDYLNLVLSKFDMIDKFKLIKLKDLTINDIVNLIKKTNSLSEEIKKIPSEKIDKENESESVEDYQSLIEISKDMNIKYGVFISSIDAYEKSCLSIINKLAKKGIGLLLRELENQNFDVFYEFYSSLSNFKEHQKMIKEVYFQWRKQSLKSKITFILSDLEMHYRLIIGVEKNIYKQIFNIEELGEEFNQFISNLLEYLFKKMNKKNLNEFLIKKVNDIDCNETLILINCLKSYLNINDLENNLTNDLENINLKEDDLKINENSVIKKQC
ncbi:hypothetical protein HERIO_654 [Hepatospora eriocheir]|uniref:Uncharacterized protein n=1 Tax=Hepatospora eriocheir TaxID=1081669 RepID=A0A1X0QCR2_9MICR|nr:hypothetical protein HERIO_654 [Hepatospora eriocheir]